MSMSISMRTGEDGMSMSMRTGEDGMSMRTEDNGRVCPLASHPLWK